MEMKEKKTSIIQGTKALGVALVANISPAISQAAVIEEEPTTLMPENVRIFSTSDLANLTLHQVAREGDVMLMEKLLERISTMQQKKKRLNEKDDGKLTPMHYAARYNHYHMISYLIKNGASVQIKGEDDATPLHFIAKYKKKRATDSTWNYDEASDSDDEPMPEEETLSCLKLLVDNGAQVNARDAMSLTPLHQACTRGNTDAVRELLSCVGVALEMADHQGMTALNLACLYGRKTIVKLLLEAGANIRCRDKDLTTPLHLACAEGSIDIAQVLLAKADTLAEAALEAEYVNLENNKGNNHESSGHNRKPSNNGTSMQVSTSKTNIGASPATKGSAELLQDVDAEKNLPLHLAIENGHMELVKFCIQKSKEVGLGSMVHQCRSRDDTCLHLAVQANSIDIVKLLMAEGGDVNARNSALVTPLFLACQHNCHIIVKHLLENGANVELKDSDFMSPLLIASRYGHLETLTWLLEHRADITETDKDDRTCLMWAADEDRTDAIKLLMKSKKMRLMIEERDRYNNTALHLASMKGHTDTVKLLLDYRASADIKNDDDRTTLHMAAFHGHDSVIPPLIKRDRSIINAGDEEANTALHLACIGGNIKSVVILIQMGANIELRNAKQWTPLDCAAANGWVKPARVLLEAGASIQPRGKIKICALHLACQRGHVDMIALLLQWRADVTFRSADGRNALDYAIDHSQKDCVRALLRHETWKQSMKNAVIHPVTGLTTTPMRRLIIKMEDMAEIVCNQCVTDNGKKPEDDDYTVTLAYEFFDDMYACTEWSERSETTGGRPPSAGGSDYSDENVYTVYDEHDQLTKEAHTYVKKSDVLQNNHPLKIMVESKCESLLLHPVVTGLLNYKWRRFGRYVYYSNLLFFIAYLTILNVYMMLNPPFYNLDWIKIVRLRKYLASGRNATGMALSNATLAEFQTSTSECYFFRADYIASHPGAVGCQTLSYDVRNMKWAILGFSILNLLREIFQFANRRLNYLDATNLIEVTLYVTSLILTIDFYTYSLDTVAQLTASAMGSDELAVLDGFQADTGLRQEWQQEMGAFTIFLSWMGLLLFIQKIPRLGIFVVMFTDILKTFTQFFLVFVFFIFGFALSFTILLGNQDLFSNWYTTLVTTTVMMIGELSYGDIFYSAAGVAIGSDYKNEVYTTEVSFVLFVIFLIVMTIIIMNLLVGLAVGDIIAVQEHATLERLGMQVDLTLDVEFTLPAFLRKKSCLRKQTIEINRYRKSDFVRKFLFEDSEMTVDHVSKALDREGEAEQDEASRSIADRVMSGLSILRGRVNDLIADQSEVKQGVRTVRAMVREARVETRTYSEDIKDNLLNTGNDLTNRINLTRDGLEQTTQRESTQTRGKVDTTREMVDHLQQEVELTKSELGTVKADLEKRMEAMQEALLSRGWEELRTGLNNCNLMIERSRNEIMENLEEMKIVLVKEKFMSNV
uniref:transient receptor potential cation channel subfamily A member 1 homolog isoform X2 n=1 Tax=Ciona intestinalis TaxID=7719 RepID=UPI0002B8D0E7|nr:transient receptor potential cation channel subfamily A member 1 homolog isoform X2 [Ciona intestinalis]|eukprot:XP_018668223.2 transient receptor potential cation channel subfamily A member 1 homolog isoform X2 [Ciona intestinalis]